MQGIDAPRQGDRKLDPGYRPCGLWVLAFWLLLTFPCGTHVQAAEEDDRQPMLLRPNTQQKSDRPLVASGIDADEDQASEVTASQPFARTVRSLAPPSSKRNGQDATSSNPRGTAWGPWSTSAATLVGLSLGMLWWWRRRQTVFHPTQESPWVECLGTCRLAAQQHCYVVRFGDRLLLVAKEPGNLRTLDVIDDPEEVERMIQMHRRSATTGLFGRRDAASKIDPSTLDPLLRYPSEHPYLDRRG
jgi:flagellar biogenesis protein FliO